MSDPTEQETATGGSLKDHILAARTAAMNTRTVELEIPGYGGRLWGEFRAVDDYAEMRKIGRKVELDRSLSETDKELYVSVDTLLAASLDTFALKDGKKEPLGAKLGLPLAQYLGLAAAGETDRQAVFSVIPASMDVMLLFEAYGTWRAGSQAEVEEELEGK